MFKGIRFNGYKSFSKDKTYEISDIKYLNIFIGKNNCGKSSVLNVVQGVFDGKFWSADMVKPDKISCLTYIDGDTLRDVYGCYVGATYSNSTQYVGYPIWCSIKKNYLSSGNYSLEYCFDEEENTKLLRSHINWDEYVRRMPKPKYEYSKISAERDIVLEKELNVNELYSDGSGASNLIRRIINHRKYDEKIIEVELLQALNKIMKNDAQFVSIRIQEIETGQTESITQWEVYLQEKNSDRFALSQSGSGLKTIILVLLNLIVLPKINGKKYLYGFEELENNLHPALQRRLFEYIYQYAVENETYIFLTTHSHVAINLFFDKEHASIYHITKEEQVSSIKKIDNYLDKVEILDDLDVKASDLLQANGIIWVEGPSDRIYIKRWLELFGGTDIQEGKDYQFAYYGGRLLSHYTANEEKDLINILLINRNSAIVMDSDKRSRNASINDTKKRIINEFSNNHLFTWITKGKEIENYLRHEDIQNALEITIERGCEQYEIFDKYIDAFYKNFSGRKVAFATQIREHISPQSVFDLEGKIKKLYLEIKSWNS